MNKKIKAYCDTIPEDTKINLYKVIMKGYDIGKQEGINFACKEIIKSIEDYNKDKDSLLLNDILEGLSSMIA